MDPVERQYHSESVLYQDGTVISVGSNPGDGSFDMRISVYKPPYLFKSEATDPERTGHHAMDLRQELPDHRHRRHHLGRADQARCGDP